MRTLPLIFLFCFGLITSVHSSDEEKDWLEYYYENPSPERFVAEMKNWAEEGVLDNENAKPALIAFLSCVIRENREQLKTWYAELAGLTPSQKQVLHTAMLFSRVSEADEIMSGLFGKQYTDQKKETRKILEMPLDKKNTLDMLWGFYYATGSENAVRRVVLCFRFEEAPARPDKVDVPEGYMAFYKILPDIAFDSLVANGERHESVRELLVKFYEEDDSLIEVEKEAVYDVLSVVDPENYPSVDRSGEGV